MYLRARAFESVSQKAWKVDDQSLLKPQMPEVDQLRPLDLCWPINSTGFTKKNYEISCPQYLGNYFA